MNEDEKYFFDLNGYIVVRNVLSAEDIALANEAIDRHADQIRERIGELSLSAGSKALEGSTGRGDLGGALLWPDPHGPPLPRHASQSQGGALPARDFGHRLPPRPQSRHHHHAQRSRGPPPARIVWSQL